MPGHLPQSHPLSRPGSSASDPRRPRDGLLGPEDPRPRAPRASSVPGAHHRGPPLPSQASRGARFPDPSANRRPDLPPSAGTSGAFWEAVLHSGICSPRPGPRPKRPLRSLKPRTPASPSGPDAPARAAPARGHEARQPPVSLRRGSSHTPPGERKVPHGGGTVSREPSSGATPPRVGYWECVWTSAARVRLGRCVTWPGGYRGDRTGARRASPTFRAVNGSPERPGCGRPPGSCSETPTSPPRTPHCFPASPRRWPSSGRTSRGGGPRCGPWRGSRAEGRAPGAASRAVRGGRGGRVCLVCPRNGEGGPSGGSPS